MKKIIKILATFSARLAFAATTFVATQSPEPAHAAVPAAEMKTEKDQATVLTGKVVSVDPKSGKLTIKTMDREVNLTTDSKTTRAALEKLKIGDTAKVFEKGGKVIAASPLKADSKTKAAQ